MMESTDSGCIGTQSSGSRESQTKPRAKGTSESGAMSPRRFQSVSVVITALARAWQRDFDRRNPPPDTVGRWERARRQLQRDGALPPGADQATPAVSGGGSRSMGK